MHVGEAADALAQRAVDAQLQGRGPGAGGERVEFYGRGPTRTKSYYEDDVVTCLLRGGFSRVEQTLLEGGRGSSVIQQRMEFRS